MLLPSIFLFAAAALSAWALMRSGASVNSAAIGLARDTGGGERLLCALADGALPLLERVLPHSLIHAFSEVLVVDERAQRLGEKRLACLAALFGVAVATLLAWLALGTASVRIAGLAILVPPMVFGGVLLYLRGLLAARRLAIRREFPYSLDLLVLLCRAGAPPAIALARACADTRGSVWTRELRRAVRETELGTPRAEAFGRLSDRMGMPEVTSFVATVRQAEEMGRPLADALEQFADRLREQRVQLAEAAAGTASVKIMMPAIIVFMASVVMLLGPFGLKFMKDGLPI